jgi:hypothetical protein
MDFVSDAPFDGGWFRALTVLDAFTREALAIEVDQGVIKGEQVVDVMTRLALIRRAPRTGVEPLTSVPQSHFCRNCIARRGTQEQIVITRLISEPVTPAGGNCESASRSSDLAPETSGSTAWCEAAEPGNEQREAS